MKKIIHLSDPHLGCNESNEHFDLLVEKIIRTYTSPEDYVVVITGDLIDDPLKDPLFISAKKSLRHLYNASFNLLIVPGNHDYYSSHWDSSNKEQVLRFKEEILGKSNVTYPIITLFDSQVPGDSIAFIGLDSMPEELQWNKELSQNGKIGDQQLDRLIKLLNNKDVKSANYLVVYFHHHPFGNDEPYTLLDRDSLRQVLENSSKKVDLMLLGHKHDNRSWNGQWGIPRIYNSGSCTYKNKSTFSFRVIDLQKDIVDLDIQREFTRNLRSLYF